MSVVDLIFDLKKVFESDKERFGYKTKSGELKKPDIRTGYFGGKTEKDFPYIVISPLSDSSNRTENDIDIMFVCAVYDKDYDGWIDCGRMADSIKLYLKERWSVMDRYPIDLDTSKLKIEYPEVQPIPQWFCYLTVRFNIENIEDVSENIFLDGGYLWQEK